MRLLQPPPSEKLVHADTIRLVHALNHCISVGLAADGTLLPDLRGLMYFLILCSRTSGVRDAFRTPLHSTTTNSVVMATEVPQLTDIRGIPNFLILCSRTNSSRDAFISLLHSTRNHKNCRGAATLQKETEKQVETIDVGSQGGTF